ncbi:hypothetical protein CKM354_000601100 [Cercospora kikuchii]|uniref:Uncharacterized protein n=1 Tax=Cercospora kikuchii TaxID=84275 RepID=A0A9P3FCZ3_9PEZI|nr:uncharacterized protein CKM354_000601100 [Cercospora kikuchii]GIZ42753.1 hypothetical protein CKM354_000601100 [Cercospora kikuchii]
MQRESEIDKFLAALCQWLGAIHDGIAADIYRMEMDAAHPHLSVVTVPSNIVTLRQRLRDYESRVHEARSQSSLVVDFCRLNQLLQCEYVEQKSKLSAATDDKKSLTLKINQLEEKLRKIEGENDRLIRQKCAARVGLPRGPCLRYGLDHGAKSHLLQVMDRLKAAERDYKLSLQDYSDLKNKYHELVHKYKQIEASLKQLATGRQRRDSGLEDRATNTQKRAASLPSDPLALRSDIECSISMLREQQYDQHQRLTELESMNEELQAELDDLKQDKAALDAHNAMTTNRLSSSQQAQWSLQDRSQRLEQECNALWEHLIHLEVAGPDAGKDTMPKPDKMEGGWMQDATAVVARVLQEVNGRQKLYYVLH